MMPEASKASLSHAETKEVEPGYFGYYIREIQELLSLKDSLSSLSTQNPALSGRTCAEIKVNDINTHRYNSKEATSLTGSSSLFSNGVGDRLSVLERERLKAYLKRGVTVLSREVDEILDPVLAMYRVKAFLRNKENLTSNPNVSDRDVSQSLCKKQRMLSPSSSTSISTNAEALASQYFGELNEDLRILLESGESHAKEVVKKYSDELSAQLECMEQQLEELLDIVMSVCRQMTLSEKQELQKLIQNLPSKNLDRVIEILVRKKLPEERSCSEVHIDLDKEENVTLWRLYFYVEAVARAKKLSSSVKVSTAGSVQP